MVTNNGIAIGTIEHVDATNRKWLVAITQDGMNQHMRIPRIFVEIMYMRTCDIMKAEVILNEAGYCYLRPVKIMFNDLTTTHPDDMDEIALKALEFAADELDRRKRRK